MALLRYRHMNAAEEFPEPEPEPAGNYRLIAFLSIPITFILCLVLLLFAPDLHRQSLGSLDRSQANEVLLNLFVSLFIPWLLLSGSYFSVASWAALRQEPMYRWQKLSSLVGVVFICLLIVGYLSWLVIFVDFAEHPGPGGHQPANPAPADKSFSYRAGVLLMYLGGPLAAIFGLGLLGPSPNLHVRSKHRRGSG